MKANTSLLALSLFTIAGVVTVSCGGSSDSDDSNDTAGSSSTAGSSNKAGSSNTAGSSASAGTTNNTGGTGNTAGTANNGGRNNTAGTINAIGGAFDFPGVGGAGFMVPSCPTGTKDGDSCTPGAQPACQLNDTTYCGCQSQNDPTWTCVDTTNLSGAGGAGLNIPEATCPANAMNGDDCSNGPGTCADSQRCFCDQNDKIMCF